MKKYGAILRKTVTFVVATIMIFSFVGCNRPANIGKESNSDSSSGIISGGNDDGFYVYETVQGEKTIVALTDSGAKQSELLIPSDAEMLYLSSEEVQYPNVKKISFESASTDASRPGCLKALSGLEEIEFPKEATKIPHMSQQTNLKSVIIPGTVKAFDRGHFLACENLSSVVIEEGVEEIAPDMFDSCTSLSEISLPSSIRTIGDHAFENCSGFEGKKFVIPEGVEQIGKWAFYQTFLSEIYLPESLKSIDEELFTAGGVKVELCTVYVKEGSWADEHFDDYGVDGQKKAYY